MYLSHIVAWGHAFDWSEGIAGESNRNYGVLHNTAHTAKEVTGDFRILTVLFRNGGRNYDQRIGSLSAKADPELVTDKLSKTIEQLERPISANFPISSLSTLANSADPVSVPFYRSKRWRADSPSSSLVSSSLAKQVWCCHSCILHPS